MSGVGDQEEGGVLGGHWGFLTGDVEDRDTHDVMDDLILHQT